MTTPPSPSRRRTDRARVEQCTEAIVLLEAIIATRDATRDMRARAGAEEIRAYNAAALHAEVLYVEYVGRWPRTETRPGSDPTMRVKQAQDAPQGSRAVPLAADTAPLGREALSAAQADSTDPTHPEGT